MYWSSVPEFCQDLLLLLLLQEKINILFYQVISGCNHEGTRLVLHDSKVDSTVVSKDTVVYILMIWAY